MGLIWDRESFHSRLNINQVLVDLLTVVRPNLIILDATRALISGGPGGPGEVHKPNLIIAGTDPVAVDSFGVTVAPCMEKISRQDKLNISWLHINVASEKLILII